MSGSKSYAQVAKEGAWRPASPLPKPTGHSAPSVNPPQESLPATRTESFTQANSSNSAAATPPVENDQTGENQATGPIPGDWQHFDPWGLVNDENGKSVPWFVKDKALVCCIDIEANCFPLCKEDFFEYCDLGRTPYPTDEQFDRRAELEAKQKRGRPCEIGMSFFDAAKLGSSWYNKSDRWSDAYPSIFASAVDFAIIENEHVVAPHHPAGFCREGRPENFRYGRPTWILLNDARTRVTREINSHLPKDQTAEDARVVFVFFAQGNDMKWLKGLGVDLYAEYPNCKVIDIQKGPLGRETARNLSKKQCSGEDFVAMLGLDTNGAHNGGNDAVHELQAFLAEWSVTEEQRQSVVSGSPLGTIVQPIVREVIEQPMVRQVEQAPEREGKPMSKSAKKRQKKREKKQREMAAAGTANEV